MENSWLSNIAKTNKQTNMKTYFGNIKGMASKSYDKEVTTVIHRFKQISQ